MTTSIWVSAENCLLHWQLGWSTEGMRRIERHATELLPRYADLVVQHWDAAGGATLPPVRPEP